MRWLLMVLATVFVQVAAAETKIAVVDMERALFLSDAAKSSYQQFQNDNKRDVDQLKSLEADLISIREKREKDGAVMSTDEMNKLQSEFEEKGKEYQFYQRKLQQLDQKWKRDFFQSKLPDLEKLLKAIIDEGGYDVVYQAGAVVYAIPEVDLTKLLLERLNEK